MSRDLEPLSTCEDLEFSVELHETSMRILA